MQIFPIVVTYFSDYMQSAIYKGLLSHYPDCDIMIYDNSPTPINEKYGNTHIHYFHDASNSGVSAAYNKGAAFARMKGKSHILLLDQDTYFEKDYLRKLEKIITTNPETGLITPIVLYDENRPFSPVKIGYFKPKGVRLQPGAYSLSQYIPVNSGACISLKAFDTVGGYNTNLLLDFADFDFFKRLCKEVPTFILADSIARQQFSNKETNQDALIQRFKIYIHDAKQFNRQSNIFFPVLRHTLALTIRTRSLKFISYYFHQYF